VNLLLTSQLKGGPLTVVKESMDRKDLKLNKVWLLPFVKKSPDRVPSAFFVADVFMAMDVILNGKLLRPVPGKGDSKVLLALAEAQRVKSLFSYLRYLWRATPVARDHDIDELKKCLTAKLDDNTQSEPENSPAERDGEESEEEAAGLDAGSDDHTQSKPQDNVAECAGKEGEEEAAGLDSEPEVHL
jgi:hypothetical protein